MESVTVSRTVDTPRSTLRGAIEDVGPFMRAAGFDEVEVEGDDIRIVNRFALAEIELDLRRLDVEDAVLSYEQRDGIFESMTTVYRLDDVADGTRIEATTEFALDVALVGDLLDATVIRRQRRTELNAQFDYLEGLGSS